MTLAMKMEVNNQLHIDWGRSRDWLLGGKKYIILAKRGQHRVSRELGVKPLLWLSMTTAGGSLGKGHTAPLRALIPHEERAGWATSPRTPARGQYERQLLRITNSWGAWVAPWF